MDGASSRPPAPWRVRFVVSVHSLIARSWSTDGNAMCCWGHVLHHMSAMCLTAAFSFGTAMQCISCAH